MTAFAACLFALAAVAATWTVISTLARFGPTVRQLRDELAACPSTLAVEWKTAQRMNLVAVPGLGTHRERRVAPSGSEWLHISAALDLAA
jgi:hypothetical protein